MDKTRKDITELDKIRNEFMNITEIDKLKKVYRQYVFIWHPDKNNWDTTQIMQEINNPSSIFTRDVTCRPPRTCPVLQTGKPAPENRFRKNTAAPY